MMDAISFVLGVNSSHLRSLNLKDLIYRGRRDADDDFSVLPDPTDAHVGAIYEKSDGEILNLKRTINSNGSSDYKINDKTVTALQYILILKSENILVKAKNFLVFQGDVEQIAAQSPRELSKLIETISESSEFAKEYERLKEEQEKAHEVATSVFSRKRTLNSESKQYKEQLVEQELFEKKLTERNNLIKTSHLYKLYHSEQKHFDLLDQLKAQNKELESLKRKLKSEEVTYKSIIADYSLGVLTSKKFELQIADLGQKSEAEKRRLIPIQAKKKSLVAKISLCSTKIRDLKQDIAKQTSEKKEIEKRLHETRRQYRKFQTKASELANNTSIAPEAIKEYESLRSEYLSGGGSQLEDALGLLSNDEDSVNANIDTYNNQKTNALSRISELESTINVDLKPSLNDLTTEITDLLTYKQEKLDSKESLIKQKEEINYQELELNVQLREVLMKLDELSSQQRESAKQKKLRENVAMLKNSFKEGAIRGIVHELVRPSQQRYENALLTVLARNSDAIIVESTSVAYKCIEIMKEARSGVATFIPLDSIVNDPINLNYLRSLHQQAKPAIDIVEYEDVSLENAIKYVVGDTIVVDDIEIARALKWGSSSNRLDNKLVALDGSVIHKSGLMTGGQPETKSSSTLSWNKAEWKRLNSSKDDLLSSLAKLNEIRPKEIEINLLVEDIRQTEEKLPSLRNQISNTQRKIEERSKEIEFHKQLISELGEKIIGKQRSLSKINEELQVTQSKIKSLQEKIYSDFAITYGFKNGIEDYENLHGSSLRTRAKENTQFTKIISSLSNQLEFQEERLKDTISREKNLQENLFIYEQEVLEVENEVQTIKNVIDEIEAELEITMTEKNSFDGKLEELLKSSKSLEANIQDIETEIKNSNKNIAISTEALLKVDTERLNILRNCKIASVDIPLEDGFLDTISLNGDTDKLLKDIYSTIEIDYSLLNDRLRETFNLRMEAEIAVKLENIISELERLTPNAKAVERLKEVDRKLKSFERDFTIARRKEQKIVDEFNKIKQERYDAFMNAFKHISEQIDFIYKELTKSAASPLGGSAYLTLEDEDEPYNSGIKYHAMPPMKRFRDMELLSGGEKTMAALTLLFAIHLFQPSPFFVLDEIDAALDNSNVAKIANYIKTHAGPDFQFIVISLKSSLFEKSDALVGIYREQQKNSSKTVNLDLREYSEEEVQIPHVQSAAA